MFDNGSMLHGHYIYGKNVDDYDREEDQTDRDESVRLCHVIMVGKKVVL